MTSANIDSIGWTSRRWIVVFLVILGAHVGLIFFVSAPVRAPEAAALPTTLARTRFLMDPETSAPFEELLTVQDPTVFSHPHGHGFSASTWSVPSRFSYQATNWTEPFKWLTSSANQLGGEFNRFVESVANPPSIETNKLPPPLAEVKPSTPAFSEYASVRVDGELAERPILSTQTPPRNEPNAILNNTVVRLTVNESGETLTATLLAGSGSQKADQAALEYARRVRFAPVGGSKVPSDSSENLTFGTMVFHWLPVSSGSTNSLATARP